MSDPGKRPFHLQVRWQAELPSPWLSLRLSLPYIPRVNDRLVLSGLWDVVEVAEVIWWQPWNEFQLNLIIPEPDLDELDRACEYGWKLSQSAQLQMDSILEHQKR